MKSKKITLRAMEVILGLVKIDDIVDYDIRGIIRDNVSEMERQMKDSVALIKTSPYELKIAFMKFFETITDLAEAEYGPHFTPKNLQEAMLKVLNGNPLNMMVMLNKNNIIKN